MVSRLTTASTQYLRRQNSAKRNECVVIEFYDYAGSCVARSNVEAVADGRAKDRDYDRSCRRLTIGQRFHYSIPKLL